jgi:hypothetical protein
LIVGSLRGRECRQQNEERFHSIQRFYRKWYVGQAIADPELAWLFENRFPNTLNPQMVRLGQHVIRRADIDGPRRQTGVK